MVLALPLPFTEILCYTVYNNLISIRSEAESKHNIEQKVFIKILFTYSIILASLGMSDFLF